MPSKDDVRKQRKWRETRQRWWQSYWKTARRVARQEARRVARGRVMVKGMCGGFLSSARVGASFWSFTRLKKFLAPQKILVLKKGARKKEWRLREGSKRLMSTSEEWIRERLLYHPPTFHMDSIWNGYIPWIPHGFHVDSMWTHSTWNPHRFHMDSIWIPCGIYLLNISSKSNWDGMKTYEYKN